MKMKKLTDEQIQKMELLAKMKKKGPVEEFEKPLLKQIDNYMKNDWKGMRITNSDRKAELKRELMRLKNKVIKGA